MNEADYEERERGEGRGPVGGGRYGRWYGNATWNRHEAKIWGFQRTPTDTPLKIWVYPSLPWGVWFPTQKRDTCWYLVYE